MQLKLVISVIVLSVSWRLGQSCTCLDDPLEVLYCRSSFVAKFYIRSELKVPGVRDPNYNSYHNFDLDGFYRVVLIQKAWKFPNDIGPVDMTRLYTPANDGMCKLYLQKGRKYLISGRVSGGELHVDMCGSIKVSTKLPRSVKRLKRFPPKCQYRG